MVKVLVVDDEVIVRVGLKSAVEWEKNGFELIGEASNGRQALDLMLENKPDIVVTDIKMPVMDGIQLIKNARQEGLGARFVVLSCHDDFVLVKEAMKLGAEEYFLKLNMEPEELLKVLLDIKGKIEEDRKVKEEKYVVEKNVYLNMPVLREKFFNDLIFGPPLKDYEIKEKLVFLGVDMEAEEYFTLVMKIDRFSKFEEYSDRDRQLINFAILNIVNEILDDFRPGYAFSTKTAGYGVIAGIRGVKSQREIYQRVMLLGKKIRDLLLKYMDISVSIGISNGGESLNNIKRAYTEAASAAEFRYYKGRGSIIPVSDVTQPSDGGQIDLSLKTNELEESVKNSNGTAVRELFAVLVKSLEEGTVPKDKAQVLCTGLVLQFINTLRRNGENSEKILGENYNPNKDVHALETIEDMKEWMNWLCCTVIEYLDSRSADTFKRIVTRGISYIQANYNKDISLNDAAVHLNVNASYLSNLFSQETGRCFTDYLTDIRIRKAKELIDRSGMKMYEIAEAVGYSNVYYFSKIFKKVVGQSPMEYKDRKTSGG